MSRAQPGTSPGPHGPRRSCRGQRSQPPLPPPRVLSLVSFCSCNRLSQLGLKNTSHPRDFPAVQWLGLHASNAGGHRFDPWSGKYDPLKVKSENVSHSVMSDSLQPQGLTIAHCREILVCPWNSPGKNTGVGSHFLLQGISPTLGANPVSHMVGGFFTI